MESMTREEFDEFMRTQWIEDFIKGVHKSKWLDCITVTMKENGNSIIPWTDWKNAIKDELSFQNNLLGIYIWD